MTDNPHLEHEPVAAGVALAQARMAGVLVHGRGQDEQTMLDVVDRLALADVGYLLPLAAGHVWYPGRYFDPLPANAPWLAWSLDALEAAIARARAAGLADERIVLAGFSQGACLVAELMARRPRRLAGAAVLTGALMGPDGHETRPDPVAGVPMFFASSRHDEWIAFARAQATAEAFAVAGARVALEAYEDREHLISDRAVDGLRGLLTDERTGA